MANERNEEALRRLAALTKQAESIGATRSDRVSCMLDMLRRSPFNSGLAKVIEAVLVDYKIEQQRSPNLLASPPEADELFPSGSAPDCNVGETTETSVPYGPRVWQDSSSLAILGIPHGGKTNLLLHILCGLRRAKRSTSIVVFDVKGEFSCLATLPGPNVHVHQLRDLRLNLLRPPPHVPLPDWLAKVASYIVAYRGLMISRNVLVDACLEVSHHFGVDADPTRPWPSIKNVYDYLSARPRHAFGKSMDYLASLLTELGGFLRDSGDLLDTCDGLSISSLITPGALWVIQMDGVDTSVQQTVCSLLVEGIIAHKKSINRRNVPMEVLVAMDEAQLCFSEKADAASRNGLAPLAQQLLKAREQGVAFAVVGHLVGLMSRAVLASATTLYLVGGLGDADSCTIAAKLLNLPPRAITMIPRLGRGQMLVREIGKSPYTDAFLVDINSPVMSKDVITEPTRRQLMATKLASIPATPSRPLSDYPMLMAMLNPGNAKKATPATLSPAASSPSSSPAPTALPHEHYEILIDAIRHRDDYLAERRRRLNVTDYARFDRVCHTLEFQHLLILHSIRLGRVSYHFLEVTDVGFQSISVPKPAGYLGHGGFVHTVLISRGASNLKKKGWKNVRIEHPVAPCGHRVDLFGVDPAGIATAFEITLSLSNVVSNALKTLTPPTAVQQLVFLCTVDKDCKAVERMLKKDLAVRPYLPRIRFERIDRYMS